MSAGSRSWPLRQRWGPDVMAPLPVPWWLGLAALVAASGPPPRVEQEYVEVPGVRCHEKKGYYPLGYKGAIWTDHLHTLARQQCDADADCVGFMRFVGQARVSCKSWCGRPQFCMVGGETQANGQWVSYIKGPHFGTLQPQLPPATGIMQVQCSSQHRGGSKQVFILRELMPAALPGDGACNVLHHRYDMPDPSAWVMSLKGVGQLSQLDGILSEALDEDLPYFGADLPPDDGPGPWRYFLDAHDYPADRLGSPAAKNKFMSIYFKDDSSWCPGPQDSFLLPEDAEEELPGHVYVDDGTHATRVAAFSEYQVTIICGDFDTVPFPPAALVYSLAYASHPIVSKRLYENLTSVFFHMQDAAQPYKNVNIETFLKLFKDMFENPEKEKQVHYKQTFLFLAQQLFFYRYREPVHHRAASAACVICAGRARGELRQAAVASVQSGEALPQMAVAYVLCSMSRRSGHAQRQAVRETWARVLPRHSAALRFFVGQGEGGLGDIGGDTDVVELPVPESYRTLNVKAFMMLEWTYENFPNMEWIVRLDDDVFLRPDVLLRQLRARPPVRCLSTY